MPRYVLRPNADVKAEWDEDPAGTAWSILDEVVEQPTAPSTGSDRITVSVTAKTSSQGVETFTLGAGEVVTAARAWVYGKAIDASNYYTVIVYDGLNSAFLASATYTSDSFGWGSATYNGSLTQAQIDALEVRVASNVSGGGAPEVDASYVEIVTAYQTLTSVRSPMRLG